MRVLLGSARARRGLLALLACAGLVAGVLLLRRWRRRRAAAPAVWAEGAEDDAGTLDEADPSGAEDGQDAEEPRARLTRAELTSDVLDGVAVFVVTTSLWLAVYAFAPYLIGWQPRSVISGSMQPSIRPGDVVVVKPGVPRLIPGVLVTFQDPAQPGRVLTHRVLRLNDDGTWTTKGDANQTADSTPLHTSAILGQPRLVVPLIGLPAYWRLQGRVPPAGIATGVVLLLLLLARRLVPEMPLPEEGEQVTSVHVPQQRSGTSDPPVGEESPSEEESWVSASASS
jgi:signal peptidase